LDNIRVAIQEYLAAQLPGLSGKGLDQLYVQVFVDSPPAAHGETRARTMRVLASLPARDTEILRAVFIEAEDKDSVASRFGVDREYLRILLHRAIIKFRDAYLEHDAELRSRAVRSDRDAPEVREVEVPV
jgi:DNA-directed RNA polymerase specialized sigma24 family protein